ncbi:MAG TPA: S24/S26 family peptidase [Myxococcota bacterium]|jgi:hypothetical protein
MSPARGTSDAWKDAALELVVEVLRTGAPQTLVARGGSMAGAIRDGARLTLVPLGVRKRAPALGDVVAVATPRVGLIIHRVVGVDARGLLLIKGDACPSPDGWFSLRDIVGIVADIEGNPVPPPKPAPARWRRGLARIARWLAGGA